MILFEWVKYLIMSMTNDLSNFEVLYAQVMKRTYEFAAIYLVKILF